MFPTGTAGAALLILRLSVAATLVAGGTAHGVQMWWLWIHLGSAILAIFLCVGLFTPYCSGIGCLVLTYVLISAGGTDQFHSAIAIVNGGILALLGPGTYSVDAHILGRKLLTLPPRR